MVHLVKDSPLSLQRLGSLLWLGFHPWSWEPPYAAGAAGKGKNFKNKQKNEMKWSKWYLLLCISYNNFKNMLKIFGQVTSPQPLGGQDQSPSTGLQGPALCFVPFLNPPLILLLFTSTPDTDTLTALQICQERSASGPLHLLSLCLVHSSPRYPDILTSSSFFFFFFVFLRLWKFPG